MFNWRVSGEWAASAFTMAVMSNNTPNCNQLLSANDPSEKNNVRQEKLYTHTRPFKSTKNVGKEQQTFILLNVSAESSKSAPKPDSYCVT